MKSTFFFCPVTFFEIWVFPCFNHIHHGISWLLILLVALFRDRDQWFGVIDLWNTILRSRYTRDFKILSRKLVISCWCTICCSVKYRIFDFVLLSWRWSWWSTIPNFAPAISIRNGGQICHNFIGIIDSNKYESPHKSTFYVLKLHQSK